VKISKTFVIGGWSNAIVLRTIYIKWRKRVINKNTLLTLANFFSPFKKS
jgi:hypothetical protein